jgi:type II intron maturase
LITHASTQPARFLGYDIIICFRNDRISARGQRDLNGNVRLRVPAEVVEKKRAQYKQRGKPLRRMTLASQTDYTILNTYQAEYRGLYQYYQLADNVCWLNKLHWTCSNHSCTLWRPNTARVSRRWYTAITP